MKMHSLLAAALCGLLIGPSLGAADDGSARRYAEFVQDGDQSRVFFLLEREDVQDELKMSPGQVAKVAKICHAPDQEVPGLRELVARYKNRQSKPTVSSTDREKLKDSFNSDLAKCIEAYQRKELSVTLSVRQKQRLGELLTQMRGPIAIVDDLAVSSKLQISDKQLKEMKKTVMAGERALKWLQNRYGRRQISAKRRNETAEDRQKELEALFTVIRGVERERDYDLLSNLTPRQHLLWKSVRGTPFPIAWPQTSLYHDPFAKPDTAARCRSDVTKSGK